ncbi:MAG: hypothetical protein SFX72_01485 [Isosphaeraceae bacterium]|nr:hypothetical protein [Isosphaeraceae bacterium]
MSLRISDTSAISNERRRHLARLGMISIALGAVLGAISLVYREFRIARLRDEAVAAARRGDWERAAGSVDRLATYRTLDFESIRIRSMAALARRDQLSAARFLGMTPENSPLAAESFEQQGFLLRGLFRLQEAESAFRRSLRLDPERTEARRALVALLGLERRGSEQEVEVWELLQRTPAKVEALRVLAHAGPAIPPDGLPPGLDEGEALTRAIEVEPENAHARAALAHYLRGRGRLEESEAILSGGPSASDAILLERLANRVEAGDSDASARLLEELKAREGIDSDARFHRLRGDHLASVGKFEEALTAYGRSREIDPRGVELRYRIGQARLAAGDTSRAEQDLAYASANRTLEGLVARMPDGAPNPADALEAARLCRMMEREREAEAWAALAGTAGNRR